MSVWLYPIAEKAGRKFKLNDGTRLKVSLENFKWLVLKGRLVEDRWWGIAQNYAKVQVGDVVFIYTGDRGTGT